MNIYQLEKGVTADYASEELAKYIELMCGEKSDTRYKKGDEGITLALLDTLGLSTEGIEDASLDDVFEVKVDGLRGYIAGSNIRSILYGIYAYLKKAGCRFIRPGKDGDYVPKVDLRSFKADFRVKADCRYRTDCIEGTVDYEVIRDYIYWLAKLGFNGYMMQATSPFVWYDRWFSHHGNKYKTPDPLTNEEADILTRRIEKDIKRSGMTLHSVGHEYMAPAFGLYGFTTEEEVDKAGMRPYIALVNGERKIMYNSIRYTNLCYSNPDVRKKIVDFFVGYMKDKDYVDYLHIWFADQRNNFCECENCMATSISDQLIQILNETDAAFIENGIDARIVFELYNDSCWPPLTEKLNNPGRFVIMPAVRQNFIDGYTKHDPDIVVPPHIHNQYNVPPNHFSMTMGFWRDWQKVYDGDCFFFDYHMYSDHYVDPGYCQITERVVRDMKLMKKFKSNGIMHCSSQRRNMPNTSPMYMVGEVLVNLELDYNDALMDYYKGTYGADYKEAYKYLSTLSDLFCPDLLRDTGVSAADEMFDDPNVQIKLPWMNNLRAYEKFSKISSVLQDAKALVQKNLSLDNPCHRKSWKILSQQIPMLELLSEGLCIGAKGDMAGAQAKCNELIDYLARTEDDYHPDLDFLLLIRRLRMMFGITNSIFAPVKENTKLE